MESRPLAIDTPSEHRRPITSQRAMFGSSDIRALAASECSLITTAAGGAEFLDHLFYCFAGFAGALLNPANQFFLFAFGVLEIVIRKHGPFLFQLALGNVPVAFDFECGHNSQFYFCCLFSSTFNVTPKVNSIERPIAWFSEIFGGRLNG